MSCIVCIHGFSHILYVTAEYSVQDSVPRRANHLQCGCCRVHSKLCALGVRPTLLKPISAVEPKYRRM